MMNTKAALACILALICIAPMAWGYTTICYPDAAAYHTGSTDGTTLTQASQVLAGYPEDGWMRFNIAAVPDDQTISSVRLYVYLSYIDTHGWPNWVYFTPLANDPLTTDPATLWSDITAEMNSNEDYTRIESDGAVPGWLVLPLYGTAYADLQNSLALDWFGVGLAGNNGADAIFDGWAETNLPYIVVSHTGFAGPTWYVDDDAPGDPGPGDPLVSDPLEDGSVLHPFDTVQEAIGGAASGDLVLVEDGLYTGLGNTAVEFFGKTLTVRSVNGPSNCIFDGEDVNYGFRFNGQEGPAALLKGLTIRNMYSSAGAAVYCNDNSSPTIIGNIMESNHATSIGGAIFCRIDAAPRIENNLLRGNTAEIYGGALATSSSSALVLNNVITGNACDLRGGAIYCHYSSDTFVDTVIVDNTGGIGGAVNLEGASPSFTNCLIAGNESGGGGGTFFAFLADPTLEFVTITGNSGYNNGTISCQDSTVTVSNSILWGNTPSPSVHVISGEDPVITCSDVEGGYTGSGNIDADPLFVSGPAGDYSLSQIAAGQALDSPCLNAGSGPAQSNCVTLPDGPRCMDQLSTRTDRGYDTGQVDMGFHWPGMLTVSASLGCWPVSGTLPLTGTMYVTMASGSDDQTRQVAGRIDVTLASGGFISNWRAGYTNLTPGEVFSTYWVQPFPALGSLVGLNSFRLLAEDVTPAPYNQPPYPAAGATDTAVCTIEGLAP